MLSAHVIFRLVMVASSVLLLMPDQGFGLSYDVIPLEDLTARAELIAVGTIVDVRESSTFSRDCVTCGYASLVVQPTEVLKGRVRGTSLTVRVYEAASGGPSCYQPGERIVGWYVQEPEGTYRLLSFRQGLFRIVGDRVNEVTFRSVIEFVRQIREVVVGSRMRYDGAATTGENSCTDNGGTQYLGGVFKSAGYHWVRESDPRSVTVEYDTSVAAPSGLTHAVVKAALDSAMQAWNNTPGNFMRFQVVYTGTRDWNCQPYPTSPPYPTPEIGWHSLGASGPNADTRLCAIPSDGIMRSFRIRLNTDANDGWATDGSHRDVQALVTHELGHALGLEHSTAMYHTMTCPLADYGISFPYRDARTLEWGDKSGAIFANTTWHSSFATEIPFNMVWTAQPDVPVTGDVKVPSGKSLEVRPGKTVKFATTDASQSGGDVNHCELIVEGALTADGTSGAITFRSNAVSPAPMDWYGIIFKSTNAGSTIKYTTVARPARETVVVVC